MYIQVEYTQSWINTLSRFRQRKLLSCGYFLDHLYRALHPACQSAVHWA